MTALSHTRETPGRSPATSSEHGQRARKVLTIRYLCHEPLPSPYTNTEQIVNTASALAHAGARVVLSFPVRPSTPTSELDRRIADYYGLALDELGDAFELVAKPGPRWAPGNYIRTWFALTIPFRLDRDDDELLYTRDPVPLMSALATGRRVVFETYRVDLSRSSRYAAWRAYCYRHRNLLAVIAHSKIARDALVAAGVPSDRVLVAHNGFSVDASWTQLEKGACRERHRLPSGPLVLYAGHVSRDKGVGAVIHLARRMPAVQFAIVGHVERSEEHRWLEAEIRTAAVENVHTIARVTPAEVGSYLRAADVLLLPPSSAASRTGRTVVPMKLFSYLAARRPIVAPRLADIEEILEHGRNALLVTPDDIDEAMTAIQSLLDDRGRADRLAAQAAGDARSYTWQERGRRIVSFLEQRHGLNRCATLPS